MVRVKYSRLNDPSARDESENGASLLVKIFYSILFFTVIVLYKLQNKRHDQYTEAVSDRRMIFLYRNFGYTDQLDHSISKQTELWSTSSWYDATTGSPQGANSAKIYVDHYASLDYTKEIYHTSTERHERWSPSTASQMTTGSFEVTNSTTSYSDQYYVNTIHCKVRSINPFSAAAQKIFRPHKKMNCSKGPDLVQSVYDTNARQYMLHIDEMAVHATFQNSSENFSCCYHDVVRSGSGGNADDRFTLLPCANFHQDFILPSHVDFLIVKCVLEPSTTIVYEDAFAFVQRKHTAAESSTPAMPNGRSKPNILMIGIDTLSRMNFRRNMPLTMAYLQKHNFFELLGYNKMGDNTFPNLMALLTGLNLTNAMKTCKPTMPGGLNGCDFVWDDFKNAGYYTAYAEDTPWMSTFNYLKKGFLKPPTDFYLRPMILAVHNHLNSSSKHASDCVGRKQPGEYIYDAAVEVMKRVDDAPVFGFFWTNSFSHDYYDMPSSMDARMLEYFENFEKSGVMDNTIMIFFSDHGCRWGKLLDLTDGFYEERLPMFFIRLPAWFQGEFPELVDALHINQNRLTSPYDIYLTLQHLIRMFDDNASMPQCRDCNKAQSIFMEVPVNRTCDDVGINEHWCCCIPYDRISSADPTIQHVANKTVQKINEYLTGRNLTELCEPLDILSVERSELRNDEEPDPIWAIYKVRFKTKPGAALFQATVDYNKINKDITVNMNSISRLNTYAHDSECISDKEAKLFCKCREGRMTPKPPQ